MKYGLLNQFNPEYDSEYWSELDDFYEGGRRLLRNAGQYLPQQVGENSTLYKARVKSAAYINYFAQISDYFESNLFGQELSVTPAADDKDASTPGGTTIDDKFWPAFNGNADLKGNTFAQVLRCCFNTCIRKRRAILAVDFPKTAADAAPMNRTEEDNLGLARAYCFEVPVEQLIDWDYDDRGNIVWAVLKRVIVKRSGIADTRGNRIEEFKTWVRDDGGKVSWVLYRTDPLQPGQTPNDETDLDPAEQGDTKFKAVPLIEMSIKPGLWVGNKIGCLAKEHFQRRNELNAAQNKSLFAIPFYGLGAQMGPVGGSIPADVAQDQGRGDNPVKQFKANGFLTGTAEDKFGFIEPSGACYELVYRQLQELPDEFYRIVQQMAASVKATSTALGRSGSSKQEDRSATEVVLGAFGAMVRDFAKKPYDLIASARGESVVWTPRGLDKFELIDRGTLLLECAQLDTVSIPSPTFRKMYKMKLATSLLGNIEVETLDTIRDEINDGIDAEGDLNDVLGLNVKRQQIDNQNKMANQKQKPAFGKGAPQGGPKKANGKQARP